MALGATFGTAELGTMRCWGFNPGRPPACKISISPVVKSTFCRNTQGSIMKDGSDWGDWSQGTHSEEA